MTMQSGYGGVGVLLLVVAPAFAILAPLLGVFLCEAEFLVKNAN